MADRARDQPLSLGHAGTAGTGAAAPVPDPVLIYADASLVVIAKPAGMLSVPGRGIDRSDCAWARLLPRFPDLRVVHRLDQATSGLMLFARGAAAGSALGRAFAQRAVRKRYVALVQGLMADDDGEIALPLAPDWPNRPRQRVDAANGKPALTRWQVLARQHDTGTTRVELEPVSGRTHQLRLHLAAVGHAILGDTLYAPPGVAQACERLQLHATSLELADPVCGQMRRWQSAAPF